MISSHTLCFVVAVCLIHCAAGQTADDDEVTDLLIPDYTSSSKIYSGYLPIGGRSGKSIHYVHFQSQNNPKKDPILLILAGQLGCSTFALALQQYGPFIMLPGTKRFVLNPNAWNANANLVLFELPAGTGFSENQGAADQTFSDQVSVTEALTALRVLLSRFPSLLSVPLYLSGDSYAGVFAPRLASLILKQNADPQTIFVDKIKLAGMLLGNPCTKPRDCLANQRSSNQHFQFLYRHNFYLADDYYRFLAYCTFSPNSAVCASARALLDKSFSDTNTSVTNIYSNCYSPETLCQDQAGLSSYLNDEMVQKTWNLNQKMWQRCNTTIQGAYQTGNGSYWLYQQLMANKLLRVWIYSADFDSTVPTQATRYWVTMLRSQLQLRTKKTWREWWVSGIHKGEDQPGGFALELDGLTFATVKAAGLKAALDKPVVMQKLVNAFLAGKSLPRKQQLTSQK